MKALLHLWNHRDSLRRLIGRKAAIWLITGGIAGLFVALMEVLISLQIGQLLHLIGAVQLPPDVQQSQGSQSFLTFGALLVLFASLRGIGYFLISQSSIVAQENIMLRLKVLAFQETFLKENGFVSLSRLSSLVSDVFPKTTLFCQAMAAFVPALLQLAVICLFLGYKSLLLTSIGIAGICVVGWIIHLANVRVRHISLRFPFLFEVLMNRMGRMVKNWFFLRAVRKMNEEYRMLVAASVDFAESVSKAYFLGNSAAVLPQSLGILVVLAVVATQLSYQPLAPIVFAAFLYLFFRLIQAIGQLAATFSSLNSTYHHFSITMDYVNGLSPAAFPQATSAIDQATADRLLTEKIVARTAEARGPAVKNIAPPKIAMENIFFRYQSDLPWTLKDFSLNVPSGGRVALMGASGSGKSTILALCMGVLRPEKGAIRVGELEPSEFFEKYSSRFGYVGPEPYLIEGSVRENLVYGQYGEYPDFELLSTLEKVGLGDWAKTIEDPLGHRLSEIGEGLSTGQKQRLMLARALLLKPVLLVLDEVSANLDSRSEKEIKQLISQLDQCTVLTVSHRMEFVRGTHEIVQLGEAGSGL